MSVIDTTLVTTLLAFLAESLTEYFLTDTPADRYKKYVAPLVGVLLAFNFSLDLFTEFLRLESAIPYVGVILTGILLGRGSNWVHDFLERITGGNKNA